MTYFQICYETLFYMMMEIGMINSCAWHSCMMAPSVFCWTSWTHFWWIILICNHMLYLVYTFTDIFLFNNSDVGCQVAALPLLGTYHLSPDGICVWPAVIGQPMLFTMPCQGVSINTEDKIFIAHLSRLVQFFVFFSHIVTDMVQTTCPNKGHLMKKKKRV